MKKHYVNRQRDNGMSWAEDDVQLVPVAWLKVHEEIKPKNRDKLLEMTKKWGGYTKPLLVDSETGSILDGHHRHAVAQRLGLKRIPVMLFDYIQDDSIRVETWPNCGQDELVKQDVIDMCLSDSVFPPKTSRHILDKDVPPILVPLEILRQDA